MLTTAVILLCAITGFGISLYMTIKFYRLEHAQPGQSVVQTPYARVFVLPNSLYGLAYYLTVAVLSAIRLTIGRWYLLKPLLVVSVIAVIFSLYLAWTLIFKMKQSCPLCFTAQALNIVIAVLLSVEC